jgi:DNA-binding MarR family transcriptional regulator
MANNTEEELERFTNELWDTIGRIMHNSRARFLFEDELEMSVPQIFLLEEIYESGIISMSELAKRTQTSQSVATRIVDRLVEKGLLTRKRDTKDRRVVLVSLSERGSEIAENLKKLNLENMKAVFSAVSRKEREDFLKFLEKIADQLEQA